MNLRKNQSGFSTVEIVLVILVVGLIVAVGWLVFDRSKKHPASTPQTNKQQVTNFEECAKLHPVTASYPSMCTHEGKTYYQSTGTQNNSGTLNGLTYQSPGNELTIILTDGWEAEKAYDNQGFLVESAKIVPRPGTKATLVDFKGGRDGISGFYFNYSKTISAETPRGNKLSSSKTKDGLDIEIYKFVETDSSEGLGALGKGGIEYTYIIRGKRVSVHSTYSVPAGTADYHDSVENSLKTVHFN